MNTLAEIFTDKIAKHKYPKPATFKKAIGPSPFADSRKWYVSYTLTFIDGSTCEVLMNDFQYHGLKRSLWWKNIKTRGENGYRIPLVQTS